ncbi:HAD family hydrolase [Tabrizicola sp.]|uniref:HAD-IIA family hydrolase n=1 Tax=Tabrizicola sp. TaxID=2005166 RepID=UPI00286D0FD9|nr:HAD hydrolase-like protein [Tabrizicola sp.]
MFDLTTEAAFARYEAVRRRLPTATFPATSLHADTLADVADRWDGFVLDAFGVVNVGDLPIPGAVARMAQLRAMGKRLCVLTNAASYPRSEALRKYHRLGFDFAADEVVSSRDIAATALAHIADGAYWGAIAAEGDSFADLPARVTDLHDTKDWSGIDAFLYLSTARWTPDLHEKLLHAMHQNPRPLVIANPDLVAPREGGLSTEPGFWAHDIADRTGATLHWCGKPFPDAHHEAAARSGLAPHRLAMVGDTLHTDTLGGRAAGMGTVLVTAHGLFAGRDTAPFISASGIIPDVIITTT